MLSRKDSKTYTGIGSRQTPPEILEMMRFISFNLIHKGMILRSGSAGGADQEFEFGCASSGLPKNYIEEKTEIYLPWPSFEEENRTWIKPYRDKPQKEAYEIAAKFHPNWKRLTLGGKSLHARNVHQILGYDVTNPEFSDFVVCWTKDGKMKGGTAQALRIAKNYDIKIYNLAKEKEHDAILEYVIDA